MTFICTLAVYKYVSRYVFLKLHAEFSLARVRHVVFYSGYQSPGTFSAKKKSRQNLSFGGR